MSRRIRPPFGAPLNPQDPLSRGLVAAWLLDEGAGTRVRDAVSGRWPGTLVNVAAPATSTSGWNSGLYGRHLTFDGTDDRVEGALGGLGNPSTSPFTLAVLVRPASVTGTRFAVSVFDSISSYNAGVAIGFRSGSDWKVEGWGQFSNPNLSSGVNPAVGRYDLIAYSREGSTGRIFVNGIERASSATAPQSFTPAAFFVGALTRGNDFTAGDIPFAGVWGRALSATDHLALWADSFRPWRPRRVSVLVSPAGGGPATYTGTGALASQPATLSATATFTAPAYTGTASLSSQPAALAASATHAAPTYTGTATLSSQPAVIAATATFTAPVYTGTGALASQPATLSASGTVTNPTYTGTATLASQPAALAATALFATAVYQGTAALASQPATLAATATFTPGANTGTGALASQPAVLNGSAAFAAPVYTGTGALASQPAVLAASAIFATAVFQGVGTLASQPAVLSGSATFTAGAVVTVYPGGTFRRSLPTWARLFRRSLSSYARVWRYPVALVTDGTEVEAAVGDDRDYAFDLTKCPEIVGGATITSSQVLSPPAGITIGTPATLTSAFDGIAAGKGVSVRVSGGTAGTTYALALEVTLSTGRKVVVPGRLVKVANTGA